MSEVHKRCMANIRAWKLMYDAQKLRAIVKPKQT